jgi:hypothetical protein
MIENTEALQFMHELSLKHQIPKVAPVAQKFDSTHINDIQAEIRRQFSFSENARELEKIKQGDSVAITAGSRGISNIALVIKEVVRMVGEKGGLPFVFPAMGSHGGASVGGQKKLIAEYGITDDLVGAPIKATMDVTDIGKTSDGRPVYIDAFAAAADHIIVINRIKAHTAFRGAYESGLMKMMVIGMGKQVGAETCHDRGFGHMAEDLPIFGNAILAHAPVLFGIGLIENAYDETCRIEIMPAKEIPKREPDLLNFAIEKMGRILISNIDVLVVDRIGKNISGDGMDPNITGRFPTPYGSGYLTAQRVVVLDLTDETHGNCFGIGMADFTTKRLFDKSDLAVMYINAMTSTLLPATKIPVIAANQREAIRLCIKTCNNIDRQNPRLIRIADTLHLGHILVSEALLPEVQNHSQMEILDKPFDMHFDKNGNLF